MPKVKDKKLEALLDHILLKETRGEKLTQHEQLVKAYTLNAPACHHKR